MNVNPVEITEYLFFAMFGQKETNDFTISLNDDKQPKWTIYFFKVFFSLYMLVTVIVLINLLIAMMSDTYQNIQSQSDIEWKYGLSKLIRKMQKTRSAPAPFNLVTSWIMYRSKLRQILTCKDKKRASVVLCSNAGYMMYADPALQSNELLFYSSQPNYLDYVVPQSLEDATRVEDVVEWNIVRRKYRIQFRNETERSLPEDLHSPQEY